MGGGFRWLEGTQTSEQKGDVGGLSFFVFGMESEGFTSETVQSNFILGKSFFLANGIKKDIAGEVVSRGFTLAVGPLYGGGITALSTNIDIDTEFFSFSSQSLGTIWSGMLGGHVTTEVPILPGILYGQGYDNLIMSFQTGSLETTTSSSFGSIPSETVEISETYFTPTYSFDLVLYPSQSFPKMKITLGTLLQVMNDDDSITMYTLGITWGKGPLYTSKGVSGSAR